MRRGKGACRGERVDCICGDDGSDGEDDGGEGEGEGSGVGVVGKTRQGRWLRGPADASAVCGGHERVGDPVAS